MEDRAGGQVTSLGSTESMSQHGKFRELYAVKETFLGLGENVLQSSSSMYIVRIISF